MKTYLFYNNVNGLCFGHPIYLNSLINTNVNTIRKPLLLLKNCKAQAATRTNISNRIGILSC